MYILEVAMLRAAWKLMDSRAPTNVAKRKAAYKKFMGNAKKIREPTYSQHFPLKA
jgi:hypothetical protein